MRQLTRDHDVHQAVRAGQLSPGSHSVVSERLKALQQQAQQPLDHMAMPAYRRAPQPAVSRVPSVLEQRAPESSTLRDVLWSGREARDWGAEAKQWRKVMDLGESGGGVREVAPKQVADEVAVSDVNGDGGGWESGRGGGLDVFRARHETGAHAKTVDTQDRSRPAAPAAAVAEVAVEAAVYAAPDLRHEESRDEDRSSRLALSLACPSDYFPQTLSVRAHYRTDFVNNLIPTQTSDWWPAIFGASPGRASPWRLTSPFPAPSPGISSP